jgi:hypothetical protein
MSSSPDPSPAPDYAGANREAVYADFETLPMRNRIDAASRLGQKVDYVDPRTGEWTTADFTGMGDQQYAQQAADLAVNTNERLQRGQLDLRQEMVKDPETGKLMTRGEQTARQTAREIEATDPNAYKARNDLTGRVMGDLNSPTTQVGADQSLSRYADVADAVRSPGFDSRFGDIYNQASQPIGDASTEQLGQNLQSAMADLQLGSKLSDRERSDVEQQARASMAARGNMLGDAAAYREASEVGAAGEARKAQRLQAVLGIQNQLFGQNSQLRDQQSNRFGQLAGLVSSDIAQGQQGYQNTMGALQTAAGLRQGQTTEDRATRAENFGKEQQKLSNASSFILGQPITNQFGALTAAQNGAVGQGQVNYQGVNRVADPSSTAGNIYGQQSNLFQQSRQMQQDQNNQWMQLAGTAGGAAMGAMM